MRLGSVLVDLAAPAGGNCELTRPGEEIHHQGVTIIGPINLPATVPVHASQLYSKNISNFLQLLVRDGALNIDLNDEILRDSCVAHQGEVVNRRVAEALHARA
jgi:NAD(P) transhydrogenase subunit alpha